MNNPNYLEEIEVIEESVQMELDIKTERKGTHKSLQNYLPELLTSLLYASAISSMLSFTMNLIHESINYITVINTFIVIFLVFADWNSRILVPLHFPNPDKNRQRKPFFQYAKLINEIISMVLLVLFYSYFLKNNHGGDKFINIFTLFTAYLFMCGLWNLLMIWIMDGLSVCELIKSSFKGNTYEIHGLEKYTMDFRNKIEKEETELKGILKKELDENNNADVPIRNYNKNVFRLKIKINFARIITQLIGNHILWVNFFVGIVILLKLQKFINIDEIICFDVGISFPNHLNIIIMLFISSIILILTLLFDLRKKISKTLFGILLLSLLLLLYISIPLYYLIYFIIIQQISIGLLIEYMTDGKNNLQTQKV